MKEKGIAQRRRYKGLASRFDGEGVVTVKKQDQSKQVTASKEDMTSYACHLGFWKHGLNAGIILRSPMLSPPGEPPSAHKWDHMVA